MRWIFRLLAFCHFGWAVVLLALAGWFFAAQILALRYLSSSTWTGALWILTGIAVYTLPLTGLAAGLIVLGRKIWSPCPRHRRTLVQAHGLLLLLGIASTAVGIMGVNAAEQSSARGGGIMSSLAWVPLLYGVPLVILSGLSLPAAWLGLRGKTEEPR